MSSISSTAMEVECLYWLINIQLNVDGGYNFEFSPPLQFPASVAAVIIVIVIVITAIIIVIIIIIVVILVDTFER